MANAPAPSAIDVPYVAQLARLELTPDEIILFQREIRSIVAYVDLLSTVDVSGVEPTAHATQITNVVRADVPGESLNRDLVLANAPRRVEGVLVQVPPVLGGDEGAP
jgi:aspartyl-tRNA(Asn)/glutamyl-tRNA(Gln) amidotransferase subunit C